MTRCLLLACAAVVALPAVVAAADPKAPNVLFCIADDASPHFGAYGSKWVTSLTDSVVVRRLSQDSPNCDSIAPLMSSAVGPAWRVN